MNSVYLFTILSTFFWGANFVLAGPILHDMTPLWAAALRFDLGALILAGYTLLRGEMLLTSLRQHALAYLITGAIGIGGFNVLFFTALQTASATDASLIMATNPLLTALLATLLLGESASLAWLFSIPLALAGVVVVISAGHVERLLHLQINRGVLLMLGANLAWALYNILSRRILPKQSVLVNTTLVVSAGAGVLQLAALTGGQPLAMPGTHALLALALMSTVGTVLAYLLWNMGVMALGAARAALFLNLVPVFAMLTAITFGQWPNLAQLTGGALVICGVIISMRKRA